MTDASTKDSLLIRLEVLEAEFFRVLVKHGFTQSRAKACARIFADNSLDGVYSHGVNRFPKFIQYVSEGHIDPAADAACTGQAGCIEQWDGHRGPGPLNAILCTDRAIELAAQQGMGCVALSNTNHWMRGGTYGRRAAENGCVFVGWTNTTANMPAWGAINNKLGNNPLVLAVPHKDDAIVLDMAISQYSYGVIDHHRLKKQQLPQPGGFSPDGKLTTDPQEIIDSQRILPIGYWKGAGLSLLLDIMATILSGGSSVSEISRRKSESGLSQVFIVIDISRLANFPTIAVSIQQILDDYHQSIPYQSSSILYPGERVKSVRADNSANGIPVIKSVWQEIQRL